MQKETENLNGNQIGEENTSSASQKINISSNGDSLKKEISADAENEKPEKENQSSASDLEFEELIKGPYKDAFANKVQSIINKRFKEQKNAENKSANGEASKTGCDASAEINQNGDGSATENNPAFENLLKAGVDRDTAYRVLHLNEFMDSSMRYGAELAAKQVADSIRQKSARPSESALLGKGYIAKTSVSSLTPQKRRELAKKALMGEEIEF